MDPNNSQPNNPSATTPQADLGTPLPDLNAPTPLSTPTQPEPAAPILPPPVQPPTTDSSNPYPGFSQTPPAPTSTTPSLNSPFVTPEPAGYTPSDFGIQTPPEPVSQESNPVLLNTEPTPTFIPPQNPEILPQAPTQVETGSFSWPNTSSPTPPLNNPYASSEPAQTEEPTYTGEQAEPAPSDLSHLVNPAELTPSPIPPTTQPETLVSTSNGGESEIPNIPTEDGHGIPKWVIGVGVGLLLAVVAASAYFILGIGKTPAPESVPAAKSEQTQAPPVRTTPIPTIATPTASPSAGFGGLPGGGGTQASSAADLLRQRQNQQ